MGTIENADRIARSLPVGLSFRERLQLLADIEVSQRPDVVIHSVAVARMSMIFGASIGMRAEELACLGEAARWHDIGKIAVDGPILAKPGRLTLQEFDEIRRHVPAGVLLLGEDAPEVMRDVAAFHHERYDGSGYEGLRCEDIPLEARIVAICDVHDALIRRRDYKAPMHEEDALLLMTFDAMPPGFGRRNFDPILLRRFVAVRLMDPSFVPSRDGLIQLAEYALSDPMIDQDRTGCSAGSRKLEVAVARVDMLDILDLGEQVGHLERMLERAHRQDDAADPSHEAVGDPWRRS